MGSGFTYQGSLKDGANPANGQYDLSFSLYDAATGGTLVNGPFLVTNQTVTDGLFTVTLHFGPEAFQGDERWLETAVRPTGGGPWTPLTPRQPITAAPYAMSLMPGATISGTVDSGIMLNVVNSGSGGTGVSGTSTDGYGVFGNSPSGIGVQGQSAGGYGVFGTSDDSFGMYGYSTNSYGVYGRSSSSTHSGVFGENNISDGSGVRGNSTSGNGVYGVTSSGIGVQGASLDSGIGVGGISGGGNGVSGASYSPTASGVYGENNYGGYGVSGVSDTRNFA